MKKVFYFNKDSKSIVHGLQAFKNFFVFVGINLDSSTAIFSIPPQKDVGRTNMAAQIFSLRENISKGNGEKFEILTGFIPGLYDKFESVGVEIKLQYFEEENKPRRGIYLFEKKDSEAKIKLEGEEYHINYVRYSKDFLVKLSRFIWDTVLPHWKHDIKIGENDVRDLVFEKIKSKGIISVSYDLLTGRNPENTLVLGFDLEGEQEIDILEKNNKIIEISGEQNLKNS